MTIGCQCMRLSGINLCIFALPVCDLLLLLLLLLCDLNINEFNYIELYRLHILVFSH